MGVARSLAGGRGFAATSPPAAGAWPDKVVLEVRQWAQRSEVAPMPEGREFIGACVARTDVYAFGG